MMRMGLLGAVTGAAIMLSLPHAAEATVITANLNTISDAGLGSGTLGVVTATDIAGGVQVDVTLSSGYNFVETGGPHTAFALNLNLAPTSVTSITPAAYKLDVGPQQATPYGTFSLGLDCTSCSNGAGSSIHGPLDFVLNGVTTANFVANSTSPGYFFAADLVRLSNGATGSVAAATVTRSTPVTPIPEPASMAVLGAGLVALGALRRHKAKNLT